MYRAAMPQRGGASPAAAASASRWDQLLPPLSAQLATPRVGDQLPRPAAQPTPPPPPATKLFLKSERSPSQPRLFSHHRHSVERARHYISAGEKAGRGVNERTAFKFNRKLFKAC